MYATHFLLVYITGYFLCLPSCSGVSQPEPLLLSSVEKHQNLISGLQSLQLSETHLCGLNHLVCDILLPAQAGEDTHVPEVSK